MYNHKECDSKTCVLKTGVHLSILVLKECMILCVQTKESILKRPVTVFAHKISKTAGDEKPKVQ
jgi:hypothetical protein